MRVAERDSQSLGAGPAACLNGSSAALGPVQARRLLIDVSTIAKFDARTGIQRVVRAVASALKDRSVPGLRVCLVAANRSTCYRQLPDDWLERECGSELDLSRFPKATARAGDVFLGLDFSINILTAHVDQIAQWRRQGVAINVVLYDLLPLTNGHWFTMRMRGNFRRWLKFIERHADQVIAISRSVADEFHQWQDRARLFPAGHIPVKVARLGSDIAASLPSLGLPEDSARILTWMRGRPTILMVGTVEPRKGYAQAIKAFQQIWEKRPDSLQLMVIGRGGWKTGRLQTRMRDLDTSSERFIWLESASDEFLEKIYQNAAGLLVASNGEGFGLPIVEALSHGLPTLVRDLPVFRELRGPGVNFFSGDRGSDLAAAVEDWFSRCAGTATNVVRRTSTWDESAADIVGSLWPELLTGNPAVSDMSGEAGMIDRKVLHRGGSGSRRPAR